MLLTRRKAWTRHGNIQTLNNRSKIYADHPSHKLSLCHNVNLWFKLTQVSITDTFSPISLENSTAPPPHVYRIPWTDFACSQLYHWGDANFCKVSKCQHYRAPSLIRTIRGNAVVCAPLWCQRAWSYRISHAHLSSSWLKSHNLTLLIPV